MPPLPQKLKRQVNERLQLQEARAAVQYSFLSKQLDTQESRFEERYQNLIAQYYRAQSAYSAAQRESARLREVVQTKQWVISQLLPYYPHPLSPELQHGIQLT